MEDSRGGLRTQQAAERLGNTFTVAEPSVSTSPMGEKPLLKRGEAGCQGPRAGAGWQDSKSWRRGQTQPNRLAPPRL